MPLVRVVGNRRPRAPGYHWPTGAEASFLDQPFRKVLLRKPCGVMRYRNHEEADAHMRKLLDEEAFRTPLMETKWGKDE